MAATGGMDGWMSTRGLTILGFGSSRGAQLNLRGRREKTSTGRKKKEEAAASRCRPAAAPTEIEIEIEMAVPLLNLAAS
jgi:hypothetical protein